MEEVENLKSKISGDIEKYNTEFQERLNSQSQLITEVINEIANIKEDEKSGNTIEQISKEMEEFRSQFQEELKQLKEIEEQKKEEQDKVKNEIYTALESNNNFINDN